MKKLIALLIALTLMLSLVAVAESGPAGGPPEGPPPDRSFGTLSMLNMTEDEYLELVYTRGLIGERLGMGGPREVEPPEGQPPEGAPPEGQPPKNTVIYYDTLDALLMALNAGDISNIEIYQSVARYLCATNDNLILGPSFDADNASETFAELVQTGVNGNDFAFMMMESNADLRDEFNTAIADMKADGTLERLVKEQIDGVIDGGEIAPIELPKIDGAETVTVAVTGALPPMDYVAADGTPAGFNTAVLAEIGQRTGKNIEIVVVDSMGRAAALASGTVDAVFWTRTSSNAQGSTAATDAERQAYRAKMDAAMTEEEVALMNELSERIDFKAYGATDMPENTITTEPYFSDVLVPVMLAR